MILYMARTHFYDGASSFVYLMIFDVFGADVMVEHCVLNAPSCSLFCRMYVGILSGRRQQWIVFNGGYSN